MGNIHLFLTFSSSSFVLDLNQLLSHHFDWVWLEGHGTLTPCKPVNQLGPVPRATPLICLRGRRVAEQIEAWDQSSVSPRWRDGERRGGQSGLILPSFIKRGQRAAECACNIDAGTRWEQGWGAGGLGGAGRDQRGVWPQSGAPTPEAELEF